METSERDKAVAGWLADLHGVMVKEEVGRVRVIWWGAGWGSEAR